MAESAIADHGLMEGLRCLFDMHQDLKTYLEKWIYLRFDLYLISADGYIFAKTEQDLFW